MTKYRKASRFKQKRSTQEQGKGKRANVRRTRTRRSETTPIATPILRPILNARPLFVHSHEIQLLPDADLKLLMVELLRNETYRSNGNVAELVVNAEERAADEGADAMSPAVPTDNSWLSPGPTCWQFKAGGAGQPQKLRGEITKPLPRQTLAQGGRFVVVASGAGAGRAAVNARLNLLKDEARRRRIPTARIGVLTSESLSTWVNEHPATAARIVGLPNGSRTISAGCWRHSTPST